MGILYSAKEENTKCFHHGYMLDAHVNLNDDSELFTCVFLKKGERRLIRKMNKSVLQGATLDNLLKLRTLTYEGVYNTSRYVLKIYNVFADNNFAYVISECCTGGFFFDVLKDNDFIISERQLAEWFYQIISALRFLEKNEIYHGNVNGYCIHFKDNRKEQIILSLLSKNKKYDNIDKKGDLYGLFFIRSPQEIRKMYYDKNNSWYVGTLLYFLLFGNYPFLHNNVLKNYYKIVNENISFVTLKAQYNYLSSHIYDFLSKTLEKNYELRLTLEELLSHPWLRERERHSTQNIVDNNTRKAAQNLLVSLENYVLKVEEDEDE
ncbi:protein kinase, putative [Plasmodium malariae]|uniref:Protein kinase, putative n=1 Tax=Plasmodium malariae TaxID=5858 RepID=A0A1C3KYD6_PLAMA|nr:protein kinase, putative [Plasmodium malariae]